MFAHTVSHTQDAMVMGIETLTNFSIRNRESIYVFQHGTGTLASSWSLQQKLFQKNDSGTEQMQNTSRGQGYEHYTRAEVSLQDNTTLIASIYGEFVFGFCLMSSRLFGILNLKFE